MLFILISKKVEKLLPYPCNLEDECTQGASLFKICNGSEHKSNPMFPAHMICRKTDPASIIAGILSASVFSTAENCITE